MQIGKLVQEGAITIKTGPFGTQLKAAEYQETGIPVLNVKNLGYGEGTVFGSINRDALNSMPISIPPKKVRDKFEAVVSPMDAAIRNNYDEICRLEVIRDSLLPRLMSGELDVSELNL